MEKTKILPNLCHNINRPVKNASKWCVLKTAIKRKILKKVERGEERREERGKERRDERGDERGDERRRGGENTVMSLFLCVGLLVVVALLALLIREKA